MDPNEADGVWRPDNPTPEELRARLGSIARHPATADPLALLEEIKQVSMPMFTVQIDALALLDHFDGDKTKVFEFLAELKDLLND